MMEPTKGTSAAGSGICRRSTSLWLRIGFAISGPLSVSSTPTPIASTGSGFVAIADDGKPMVSIVVPAYNEAQRIGESINKIDAFIRSSPLSFELIIVDDGSRDNTAATVNQSQIRGLRLLQNDHNHG